jgi:integrase
MGYGDGTAWYDPKRQRWIGRYERHTGRARRQRGQVSAKTEAECRRKMVKAMATSRVLPAYDARIRLDTFLRAWLADHVTSTVRARTADNYRSQVERHIIPALGGHKLVDVRPADILAYRNDRLVEGLSPRTVSHHLKAIRAALTYAMREGYVDRNVASLVPGPHIPTTDVRPLTLAQAFTLLDQVKGDPYEAVYVLAVTLGMRQGEILGLTWGDVDGDRLTIRKSLVWLHGRATLEDTKTDSSRRTLTLPRRAVEALERHLHRQGEDRAISKEWNPKWDAAPLVFTDRDGYAVERTVITRALYRHLDAAGLPRVTFHQLRHGLVGIAKQDFGIATEDISGIVGHSSKAETTDTYMHLDDRSAELARQWDGSQNGTQGPDNG